MAANANTDADKGLLHTPFYHNSLRRYSGVLGALLSGICIVRDDNTKVRVPIAFLDVQKYNVRNNQDLNLKDNNKPKVGQSLPRLSVKLNGFHRDPARVHNKRFMANSPDHTRSQYERVPVKIDYTVTATASYFDDLLMISEQLMVAFNPSIGVTVKDNPDLDFASDINITLVADEYVSMLEGDIQSTQVLNAAFQFVVEGYFYMPTRGGQKPISHVTINYDQLNEIESTYLGSSEIDYKPEPHITRLE